MADRRLKVVLYREAEGITARCLNLDLVAHVPTQDASALMRELQYMLAGHCLASTENGLDPFSNETPAPAPYWKMFDAGRTYEIHNFKFQVNACPNNLAELDAMVWEAA